MVYGDLISVTEITEDADRGCPEKRLVEVMIAVGPTRRQLLTAENTVRLIGNSFVFIGVG
jgi:hypothetical protein